MFCFSRPFSSFCFCLFFSFSFCCLSLSTVSTLLPSIADLLPWPGTTYVWSLGWTQNHCYQGKCIQMSHNGFHLKPVHKHSQMLTDLIAQAGRPRAFLVRRGCSHLAGFLNSILNRNLFVCLCTGLMLFIWLSVLRQIAKLFRTTLGAVQTSCVFGDTGVLNSKLFTVTG